MLEEETIAKIKEIEPDQLYDGFIEWANALFFNEAAALQMILILGSFIIGILSYSFSRKKIVSAIDASHLPLRAKRIFNNLRKLIMPIVTLVILFIATRIALSDLAGNIDVRISDVVMQVLLAWIIVRVAVQVIDNNLIRNIFALSIWVVLALSIIGVLDETTGTLDAIAFSVGEFRISALAVIQGIFYLFILLYLATFLSTFAERRVLQSRHLSRSSQVLVAKIIRVVLIVFALLIGITSAGIDLSLFAVFGGAIGLGIGFGLQKGISNLFSGMLLLLDKSIEPGDVIELENGTFGWVDHMGARYTEIITRDNKSFLIPNEDFITQRVVNWSHGDSLIRLQLEFGVHYDSDPHQVKEIVEIAAAKPERVVNDPKPVCWLIEFGDSSINFSLRFWIKDAQEGVTNIKGAVMMEIWDAFKEHGIQIPYPHREVYLHEAPEKDPAVPKENSGATPKKKAPSSPKKKAPASKKTKKN
ncbi:MAG: mechanosensitive ion channel family protein [Alphaproteobacteria bacterium]